MSRTKRWTLKEDEHGIATYRLSAWRYYADFVNLELLDFNGYVYRGHADEAWALESTLDRMLRGQGFKAAGVGRARKAHLENFKMAARGRRGERPAAVETEDDWWALGQHHGLATPLLDWTMSPYVAAYFAFVPTDSRANYRAVWALHRETVTEVSKSIASAHRDAERAPVVEFVRPMRDDNARLVSQGGLFTRAPDLMDIATWLRQFTPADSGGFNLMKIELPSRDRSLALRSLNRMNINHLSLFPDLYGASKYCNFDLVIKNY